MVRFHGAPIVLSLRRYRNGRRLHYLATNDQEGDAAMEMSAEIRQEKWLEFLQVEVNTYRRAAIVCDCVRQELGINLGWFPLSGPGELSRFSYDGKLTKQKKLEAESFVKGLMIGLKASY